MSVKRTLKISLFALALSSVCSLSTAFADDAIPDPFAAVKAQMVQLQLPTKLRV